MSLGLGALAPALMLATAAPPPAETSPFAGMPNLKFRYYDVEGRTPIEIYQSLRARAPQSGDGVAHAAWHIRVGWRQTRRGGTCEVADPQASVSITIVLPRLATSKGITPEGIDFWARTLRGLEIHEAGHARITLDHRNDFIKAAAGATCGSIDAIAKRTQARIEAIQQAYDERTRHGLTQIPKPGE